MGKVNFKLLKEGVKFPLKWDFDDYKMYILDANNSIVAQSQYSKSEKLGSHPFDKLVGDCKEIETSINPKYTLLNGDFYEVFESAGKPIGCVRGWGRLQQKKSPRPEKRQDNIAKYILNVINS